jgi:predicted lipoprotein with Yx(FWY)xxD motif
MFLKRTLFKSLFPFLLVALLAAACGNSGTTTGSAAPTSAPTTAGTTPTTASSSGPVVKTTSATVQGKSVTLLTNAQGMALYYDSKDTPTTAACTSSDGCTTTWPPLLSSGSGAPASSTTLPGTLSMATVANGAQVEYQGHLLYTYVGDTTPGQASGEGMLGIWFAATTDLKPATGSGGSPTPTATSGYGY